MSGCPWAVLGASHSTICEGSEQRIKKRIGPIGDSSSRSQNETLPVNAACLLRLKDNSSAREPLRRLFRAASSILSFRSKEWSRLRFDRESLSKRIIDLEKEVTTCGPRSGIRFRKACDTRSGSSVGRNSASTMSLNSDFDLL